MEIAEKYKEKCGEVFIHSSGNFDFNCVLCDGLFDEIIDFFNHIRDWHFIEQINQNKKNLDEDRDYDPDYVNLKEEDEYFSDATKEKSDYTIKEESIEFDEPVINIVENKYFDDTGENINLSIDVLEIDKPQQEVNDKDSSVDILQEEILRKAKVAKQKRIERKKNGDPNLFCKICNKQFTQQKSWDLHLLTCRAIVEHTKNLSTGLLGIEPLSNEKIKNHDPLVCRFCERRYKNRTSCLEHECMHTGEKLYKCEKCDKSFRRKVELKNHLKIHDGLKPHKCHLCDAAFTLRTNLQVHLRRHLGEKRYKCDYCDKRFVASTEKKLHERCHTGERPYQCFNCGKCFSNSSFLSYHIKSHADVKTVKCNQCDKYFTSTRAMKDHALMHVTVKNFKCQLCNAAFNKKRSLRIHQKNHLKKKRDLVCEKGYSQKSGIIRCIV